MFWEHWGQGHVLWGTRLACRASKAFHRHQEERTKQCDSAVEEKVDRQCW